MAPKRKLNNSVKGGKPFKKSKESLAESEAVGESQDESMATPLDFASPKRLFETFLSPVGLDRFLDKYWEKEPLYLSRDSNPEYGTYFKKLFTKLRFEEILSRRPLHFGRDANFVRYVSDRRKDLNQKGRITLSKFDRIFNNEKGTVQIHQPQRFADEIWRILEGLESFFGCLVGSNIYITPSEAQGLPPHHDDVEVFILQLEGEKQWQLHKPLIELPREYSNDLKESQIGEPTHNIILKPGDLLYFPRGTIHYAFTSRDQTHSTHLTISTYQKHTWGDYLFCVFPSIIEEALETDVSFRNGLPLNFIRSSKLARTNKMKSVIEILLNKLKYTKYLTPCEMIEDFVRNRLPPFGVDRDLLQNSIPDGSPPNLSSKVKLSFPEHFCHFLKRDDDLFADNRRMEEEYSSDDSEDVKEPKNPNTSILAEPEEKEMAFVLSSLLNDRTDHMMGDTRMDSEMSCALKFPKHFADAIHFLKTNSDRFITVSEIPLEDADKESLIRALWSSHLVERIQNDSKKSRKAIKSVKLD